jgi:riboflavin biosynthesis pyrimidine reductase
MTTARGAARLEADGTTGIETAMPGSDGRLPMDGVLDRLAARGVRVVLCEAGPTVFGQLVAAGLMDELFLTIAPRIAGRDARGARPGIADGVAFGASAAPTGRLRSIMRAGHHLFLRYAFDRVAPGEGGSA